MEEGKIDGDIPKASLNSVTVSREKTNGSNEKRPDSMAILLPESLKNKEFNRALEQFRKAFPGINFSDVVSTDLTNIGFQIITPIDGEKMLQRMHRKIPLALHEAMTQIISYYVYDRMNDSLPRAALDNYGILLRCGKSYGGNVGKIVDQLVERTYHYYYDEWCNKNAPSNYEGWGVVGRFYQEHGDEGGLYALKQAVGTVAKAYFLGDYETLRVAYEKDGRKDFDELMTTPLIDDDDKTRIERTIKNKLLLNISCGGLFMEDKKTIRINLTTHGITGILRLIAKGMKIDDTNISHFGKTTWLHEFAHFLALTKAEKRGGDKILDQLRG